MNANPEKFLHIRKNPFRVSKTPKVGSEIYDDSDSEEIFDTVHNLGSDGG